MCSDSALSLNHSIFVQRIVFYVVENTTNVSLLFVYIHGYVSMKIWLWTMMNNLTSHPHQAWAGDEPNPNTIEASVNIH